MKYKVGDKVVLKKWKAMEQEFGLNERGSINCTRYFSTFMRDLHAGTDRVVEIVSVEPDYCYRIEEEGGFAYHDDMILGPYFEPGEEIEVTDLPYNPDWGKRKFIKYNFRYGELPFVCETVPLVKQGGDVEPTSWWYARKIKKPVCEFKKGEPIEFKKITGTHQIKDWTSGRFIENSEISDPAYPFHVRDLDGNRLWVTHCRRVECKFEEGDLVEFRYRTCGTVPMREKGTFVKFDPSDATYLCKSESGTHFWAFECHARRAEDKCVTCKHQYEEKEPVTYRVGQHFMEVNEGQEYVLARYSPNQVLFVGLHDGWCWSVPISVADIYKVTAGELEKAMGMFGDFKLKED